MSGLNTPWYRRFLRDTDGATLPIYAISLLAIVAATGAAIDYGREATAHTQLAAAVDTAVLGVASQSGFDGAAAVNKGETYRTMAQSYLTANGPSGATLTEFHFCLQTGGDCTTNAGQALNVGQVYMTANYTYNRIFGTLPTLGAASSATLSAEAKANAAQWPQNLTFNMVGAKGWYYKTVTLYSLPWANGVASTTYTQKATWTYQPISLGTPTGTYNFTIASDPQNGLTNIRASALGSGYGTLTGPASVTLGQYADFFLVMNVTQAPCAPGMYLPSNWSSGGFTGAASCLTTNPNPNNTKGQTTYVQVSPGPTVCTESESASPSNGAYASYSAICNPYTGTNAKYNSSASTTWEYMFVNFAPQQQSQSLNNYSQNIGLTQMFPCGGTVAHEWEDGGSVATTASYSAAVTISKGTNPGPGQDLFYTVQTACSANAGMSGSGYAANNAPSGVKLLQ